jgi:predicted MFS family arabinose efflux permease
MRRLVTTPLRKRLVPLHVAAFLQGFALWVPVEKLFMNEIGFDAATVGLMAAAYAALVPVVEIPSGIVADRWSRRGVLIVAGIALMVSSLVMGLSNDVPVYILGAMVLGVYFAAYSGTMDSIVYDTVLEETGNSACFQRRIGRVRLLEGVALVTSALLGGWIAGLTTPRLTYFLTVPVTALSIIALLRFREPQLHKAVEGIPLRTQIAVTYRTITRSGQLRPVVALAVLTSVLLTTIYEFGPLWLVALSASAVLYGPAWAGLMSTIGLGGLLAGRLPLDRPAMLATVVGLTVLAGLTLTTSHSILLVTLAQIVLALLLMIVSIHVTGLLHDAVPSTIRSGVASGVGAFSWIAFVPFSLVFGLVSRNEGVHSAGWLLTALAVIAAALLVWSALGRRTSAATTAAAAPVAEPVCAA